MEFISDLPVVGGFLSSLIAFVVVLGVVVFVHEYGHYIVGRWCGIRAEVFSMGFGPKLGSWVDRRGTRWQIAALPLGGFVKFVGDSDGSSRADPDRLAELSEDERARSFHGAPVWKRALTVAAGPMANFILSILVFGLIALWVGVPADGARVGDVTVLPGQQASDLRRGDLILEFDGQPVADFGELYEAANEMENAGPVDLLVEREGNTIDLTAPFPLPPLVQGVEPLSAAANAGLKPGDYIRSAGDVPLHSFGDLRDVVMSSGDRELILEVVRDDQVLSLPITPREVERVNPDGSVETRVMIGVGGDVLIYPMTVTPTPWGAVAIGANRMWEIITLSLTGIRHIIVGNLGADNLQGPLGIAQISGASAAQGAGNLITLIAVISTAVGMLNLFPIPVLDGGHLLMFGYEAVAGRPPAESVLRVAMSLGLAMVLLLMLFATYNDLMRLLVS